MEFRKKEAEADNDICAWIYLFDILEESETIIKYKDGNRLVGFCGYSKILQLNINYVRNFINLLKIGYIKVKVSKI